MKLTNVQRDELLTALRTLQRDGPVEEDFGICCNLEQIVEEQYGSRTADAYVFVSRVSVNWPGITGKVGLEDGEPSAAYPIAHTYSEGERVGLWSGEQLRQRKELIAFLIDWLEQDASKQTALEE